MTIAPSGGGSVDGFEIRSDFRPLQVAAPGSVTNNNFPTTAAPTANNDIFVSGVSGTVLIAGNSFTDNGGQGDHRRRRSRFPTRRSRRILVVGSRAAVVGKLLLVAAAGRRHLQRPEVGNSNPSDRSAAAGAIVHRVDRGRGSC